MDGQSMTCLRKHPIQGGNGGFSGLPIHEKYGKIQKSHKYPKIQQQFSPLNE
jgi:hypothetical protein